MPHQPDVGDHYRDPASPGRVIKVLRAVGTEKLEIETVKAADDATSERAVGRVTEVTRETFRRFRYVDAPELD